MSYTRGTRRRSVVELLFFSMGRIGRAVGIEEGSVAADKPKVSPAKKFMIDEKWQPSHNSARLPSIRTAVCSSFFSNQSVFRIGCDPHGKCNDVEYLFFMCDPVIFGGLAKVLHTLGRVFRR
jgi:hypothetical protein